MIQELEIRRLSAKTLFSIYFVGSLFTLGPMLLLCSVSAMFGADTLTVGDAPLHGWRALGAGLLLLPVIALSLALWSLLVTWPGLWLFSKFRTMMLSFYPVRTHHSLQG